MFTRQKAPVSVVLPDRYAFYTGEPQFAEEIVLDNETTKGAIPVDETIVLRTDGVVGSNDEMTLTKRTYTVDWGASTAKEGNFELHEKSIGEVWIFPAKVTFEVYVGREHRPIPIEEETPIYSGKQYERKPRTVGRFYADNRR